MWVLRLEAQKIAAVQGVGKIVGAHLKILPRRENFILAPSHRCDRAWDVLPHRLPHPEHEVEKVPTVVHLLYVVAAAGIEDVRERRRKSKRIHQYVALSDLSHYVIDFRRAAAVVASFADQQQYAFALVRRLLQELDGKIHGIEHCGSAISRLQAIQVLGNPIGVAGEIMNGMDLAVEL